MIPLAVTSTKGWIRRLGRRWQLLHRLIYCQRDRRRLHFVWKVKVVIGEPVYYAAPRVLLGFRLVWQLRSAEAGSGRQTARRVRIYRPLPLSTIRRRCPFTPDPARLPEI